MREICKHLARIPVDPKREDDLILIPSTSTSDVAGGEEEADAEVGVMEAPISDVMTTGIYQFREEDEDAAAAAEESNDTSETPVNGAENGGGGEVDGGAAELKCLDEPSFQFSEEQQQQQQPKRPNYRVLEDPFEAAAQQVN